MLSSKRNGRTIGKCFTTKNILFFLKHIFCRAHAFGTLTPNPSCAISLPQSRRKSSWRDSILVDNLIGAIQTGNRCIYFRSGRFVTFSSHWISFYLFCFFLQSKSIHNVQSWSADKLQENRYKNSLIIVFVLKWMKRMKRTKHQKHSKFIKWIMKNEINNHKLKHVRWKLDKECCCKKECICAFESIMYKRKVSIKRNKLYVKKKKPTPQNQEVKSIRKSTKITASNFPNTVFQCFSVMFIKKKTKTTKNIPNVVLYWNLFLILCIMVTFDSL